MRVLVIEDDQRLARLIKGELEQEHLAVDVAHDGDTGVDLALRGCYDVVIADWMLPVLPRNSAGQYTDPISGDPALLVHLPGGPFVAYDAVCTHAGCTAEYDATQHQLAFRRRLPRADPDSTKYRLGSETGGVSREVG